MLWWLLLIQGHAVLTQPIQTHHNSPWGDLNCLHPTVLHDSTGPKTLLSVGDLRANL